MIEAKFNVFIVDDDGGLLKALARLIRVHGYAVQAFASPLDFLADHDPATPGCAILDVAMPGLDGLELQERLLQVHTHRPIIFMTGKGDIPMSVRAMKAGAIDFLTKPVQDTELLDAIARAAEVDRTWRGRNAEVVSIEAKLATLTPREREVLTHVVAGRLNKQIACDLGTVEKTIKVHRARMMDKMGIRTVADLVRLAGKAGIDTQS